MHYASCKLALGNLQLQMQVLGEMPEKTTALDLQGSAPVGSKINYYC